LSRQSLGSWFVDQLKSESLAYLLLLVVLSAFYSIIRHFPEHWWLLLAGFWILFSVVMARIAPVVIVPLFYKYSPVSNAALREAVMRLSKAMAIPVLDVMQIDASSKTSKANAAFTGWGASRRVILTDTLQKDYSTQEIEAIIAHEFSHYKQRHLAKLMLFGAVVTAGGFFLVSRAAATLLAWFGFWSLAELSALPVILICLIAYAVCTQPLSAMVSRRFERNADRMALEFTRRPQAFISAMEKLASQNLADRSPHPVIKFFFFDHPPIDERIAMARAFRPAP
jgi:STE24 endopeptidase